MSAEEAARIARYHLLTWTASVIPKDPLQGWGDNVRAVHSWQESDDLGEPVYHLITHEEPELSIMAVNHVVQLSDDEECWNAAMGIRTNKMWREEDPNCWHFSINGSITRLTDMFPDAYNPNDNVSVSLLRSLLWHCAADVVQDRRSPIASL